MSRSVETFRRGMIGRGARSGRAAWTTRAAFLPIVAIFVIGTGAGPAGADTLTLQAFRDVTLIEDAAGGLANGSGPFLFVGRTGQPEGRSIRRGLLAFDVAAALPAGSVITAARFDLHLSQGNEGEVAITLHRVTSDWGEGASAASGGGGAAATPGDATWLHTFHDDRFWDAPGGDFEAEASASTAVDLPGPYSWESSAAMLADLQRWLDDPAANHGWLLRGPEESPSTVRRFEARENPDPALRPALTIEFAPPCTPRPGAGPGYWARQCLALSRADRGAPGAPTEPGFAETTLPCAGATLAALGFEAQDACRAVAIDAPPACTARTLRAVTTLVFDLCSGRLQTSCPVGPGLAGPGPAGANGDETCGGATLGARLQAISALLRAGDCQRAARCAAMTLGTAW